MTAKKYQSGETDHSGRSSKIGDASVRTVLYEVANVILTRPIKGFDLKRWTLAVARRAGPEKGACSAGPQAGACSGQNQFHRS